MRVFHHDDGGIHKYPYGNGDPAQAHDVGGNFQIVEENKGDQNCARERENNDKGTGEVKEKDYADDTDDNEENDDLIAQGADCLINEIGPVIGGDDLHSLGEAGRDIVLDPFRYTVNDV